MNDKPLSPQEALPRITAALAEGRPCRLVVTGGSMLPFLRHKTDAVILSPVAGDIRRGDILFYLRAPDVCVLHRVHRTHPDGTLELCGDAQTQLEPVGREQILARVSHVERSGTLIDCSRLSERMPVALWQALRPVRPYALAVLRKLGFLN